MAKDQQWDQISAIDYLVKKTGYTGNFDAIGNQLKVIRYQTIKINLAYEEYIILRNYFLNWNKILIIAKNSK